MKNSPSQPLQGNEAPRCPEQRLAYSVAEASSVSGLGRTTLFALISEGRLPKVKLGKRTLIRHDDLQALLSSSVG